MFKLHLESIIASIVNLEDLLAKESYMKCFDIEVCKDTDFTEETAAGLGNYSDLHQWLLKPKYVDISFNQKSLETLRETITGLGKYIESQFATNQAEFRKPYYQNLFRNGTSEMRRWKSIQKRANKVANLENLVRI
jgi:hypothetical protein